MGIHWLQAFYSFHLLEEDNCRLENVSMVLSDLKKEKSGLWMEKSIQEHDLPAAMKMSMSCWRANASISLHCMLYVVSEVPQLALVTLAPCMEWSSKFCRSITVIR